MKDKQYKAIVVATDPSNGVLFAKRSNSPEETFAIFGEEIQRLLDDFDGEVALSKDVDGYGECVINATYGDCYDMKLTYSLIHEEQPVREETEE